MYAPSRHGGREPCMISHSVGGSSFTGAKFWDSTCFGSTEGFSGGSMKLLMTLSNALKISAGTDSSAVLLRVACVSGLLVTWGGLVLVG